DAALGGGYVYGAGLAVQAGGEQDRADDERDDAVDHGEAEEVGVRLQQRLHQEAHQHERDAAGDVDEAVDVTSDQHGSEYHDAGDQRQDGEAEIRSQAQRPGQATLREHGVTGGLGERNDAEDQHE